MNLSDVLKDRLKAAGLDGIMQLPPPIEEIVSGNLIDYREGLTMSMRFKLRPVYENPFGRTFGGVYALFFDATFGPFATLLTGAPTTSLDLNISFIQALTSKDKYVDVKATVVSKSKSFIILSATAINDSGDMVATCQTRMMILDVNRL